MFSKLETLNIKARFKFYPNVVCGSDRVLYQLSHFKRRRSCPFKKLTYNPERKAFRINSQWVSKKKMYSLIILKKETINIIK